MEHRLSEEELSLRFRVSDFALKTQRQIVKDFERLGHDFDARLLSHSMDLEDVVEVVSTMLEVVLHKGQQATLQLLYQIDVPQSQFLQLTTDANFLVKASELIVRREAQKVYLRSIF